MTQTDFDAQQVQFYVDWIMDAGVDDITSCPIAWQLLGLVGAFFMIAVLIIALLAGGEGSGFAPFYTPPDF